MLATILIACGLLLLWARIATRGGHHGAAARSLPRKAPATKAVRAARAPDTVEWDAPQAHAAPVPACEEPARMRDRYIAARFPGTVRNSAELRDVQRVIGAARIQFEGGDLECALELLTLAITESPAEPALRLAQIELAFLAREGALLTRLAREFGRTGSATPAWAQVCRLGRALCPGEALFTPGSAVSAGGRSASRGPETPNWIQASLDLTAEALAADFHRALAHRDAAPRMDLSRVA